VAKQPDGRSSIENANRKGPVHRPSAWAGALSVALLLFIIALRFLGDRLYDYPASPNPLPKDSLVVCLAGGKYRVEAAFNLFARGVGERLLIVGAGKKSNSFNLAKLHAEEALQKISAARFRQVEVETESRNTIENAFAVSRYLQQNPGPKNIILITSSYHMRRAQVMIENQVGYEVKVIPYPPENEILGGKNWWHTWLGIEITTVEYFKFLLASALVPKLRFF
jgi:uncharacterized SAM-binding protein YcdF (DUF218 family)